MNSSRRQFLAQTAAGAALIAGGTLTTAPAFARPRGLTALVGGTVIDVRTGRRNRHHTVLIDGKRIVGVGRLTVPRGATVLDATGKYVVPGLADMHVHSLGDEHVSPPLFLANGITTIREMAAVDPMLYDWRDRIAAGTLLGPRMVVASQIIDGDPTLWDPNLLQALVVDTPAEARAAVRRVKAEGADFVKVYSRLNRTSYLAILDEARRLGLTVHGHGPDEVTTKDVSNGGQRSIEHVHSLALSVSTRETDVRRMIREMRIPTGDYNAWFRQLHPIEWLAANTFSKARAADVFGTLRRNNTRVTPTLTMHKVLDQPDHTRLDPRLAKYLSAESIGTYDYVLANLYAANRPAAEIARQRQMWAWRKYFVGQLFAHDVPILAGTDTGTPYSVPGFALHEELEHLVQAGATPRQALYSATLEPARFLGLAADLGTVEPGRVADLVVLDADPLTDIRNTRRIHSVVTRGRLLGPAERAKMLADVEAAVKRPATALALPAGGCCGSAASGHSRA
ncbi:amidohydrolase family protein [Kribbella sandramycini]|uniref:Amidohydrolase family protein n=1 Tax=Kribbella sandramycini TaxID=60450 RepID=A0A7Y4L3F8_9ACTN|nr:amidohydrolase family protein [Kribbella sandramycini]MBB6570532.1 imidazolonepropionase-like amidohydrolase [Kribbella sandramycini]NOL43678.1 amidohydrolase family protein [Kribbella sandramycini]